MAILLNYTRKPISSTLYDPKLAYSMHLALKNEDGSFQALNHNSGVLFVKATENEDGSLNAKSLKNPYVFELQGETYGVVAVRTEGEGEPDEESKGCVVLFTTKDFLEYAEVGLLRLGEEYVEKVYCSKEADGYAVQWCNAQGSWYAASVAELPTDIPEQEWWKNTPVVAEATEAREVEASVVCAKELPDATEQSSIEKNIEGAVWHNMVAIPEHIAERLCKKLQTPYHVGIEIPEKLVAASREELLQYKAVAYYSDGTVAKKQIDWDLKNVDFAVPDEYEIEGTVHQEHFAFPVAEHRADPCIG